MNRKQILNGLELLIFGYPKTKQDGEIIDKLIARGLVELYSWKDEKNDVMRYIYDVSQKGMNYYITQKRRSVYRYAAIFGIVLLLIPYVFIML
jgi:hypothetical protein